MAHLCLHAALGAFVRRGTREPLRWNVAHDLAVDPLLRAAGLNVGATLPSADLPPGASAEEYYELLPEGTRPDDLWCDLTDPAAPARVRRRSGHFTRQDDGDEDPGDDPGGPTTKTLARARRSAAKKNRRAGDDEDEADESEPDVDDVAPAEASRQRAAVEDAPLGCPRRGARVRRKDVGGDPRLDRRYGARHDRAPAGLERDAGEIGVDAIANRSDVLRPSRRMSALAGPDGSWPDVVAMPGRRVTPAGRLCAVVDTSASIAADTLSRFLGALAAVATSEGFDEVRLVQADAEVTRDETVLAAELLFPPVVIVGRGGTDFGPALRTLADDARRSGERFTVAYLTDLDGKFPEPARCVASKCCDRAGETKRHPAVRQTGGDAPRAFWMTDARLARPNGARAGARTMEKESRIAPLGTRCATISEAISKARGYFLPQVE